MLLRGYAFPSRVAEMRKAQGFSMKEDEYLKERLEDQLIWYDKKSQYNQKCFKSLRLLEIIMAALIPFLSGVVEKYPCVSLLIGVLGVLIVVSAATSTYLSIMKIG